MTIIQKNQGLIMKLFKIQNFRFLLQKCEFHLKNECTSTFSEYLQNLKYTDYLKSSDEYVELLTLDQTLGFYVTLGPPALGLLRILGFGLG